jgi:hypothetical protein
LSQNNIQKDMKNKLAKKGSLYVALDELLFNQVISYVKFSSLTDITKLESFGVNKFFYEN